MTLPVAQRAEALLSIPPGPVQALSVLLVEDNPSEVELMLAALRDAKIPLKPRVAKDGREALDVCFRQGPHARSPRPDLILLDLNMPILDGREVLRALKASPATAHIPVIVFSMSQSPEDVRRAYQLHAAAYVSKPIQYDRFVEALHALYNFWFRFVRYVGR